MKVSSFRKKASLSNLYSLNIILSRTVRKKRMALIISLLAYIQ